MTLEEIKKRNDKLAAMQKGLKASVYKMETELLKLLIVGSEKLLKDPTKLDPIFTAFTKEYFNGVIEQFGTNIIEVGYQNERYFSPMSDEVGKKAYNGIKAEAKKLIFDRFGLTPLGEVKQGGYLDSFIQDPTVKREVRDYIWESKNINSSVSKFNQGLSELIAGDSTRSGLYDRYFNQYAYDTYNSVDRMSQNLFADRLKLQAAIYAGGVIETSRPFCKARNGKVFLNKEIDSWKSLSVPGKPANYNPRIHLGGARCRHSLNFVSVQLAMQKRPELKLNDNGELYVSA